MVIGRKAAELDKLKDEIRAITTKDREILVDVKEIKNPELDAQLVAENIALQIERRITSRRARLPSANQANGVGGAPASRTASSTSRRVSASSTTERTAATCPAAACASCRAMIIGVRPAETAASSAGLAASSMARRSRKGLRACAATRSPSSTTPRISPAGDSTGM